MYVKWTNKRVILDAAMLQTKFRILRSSLYEILKEK